MAWERADDKSPTAVGEDESDGKETLQASVIISISSQESKKQL